LAVERRLDEAALSLPEFSLTGQQTLAEDTGQRAIVCGLREISRVCNKHGLYIAGMHHQINGNVGEMYTNDVPILFDTTLVKPQPVA
jgi:hypothetical protein